MDKTEVIVTFSNGEKIKLDKGSIIFPIKLIESNGKIFCSKANPVVLEEYFHIHDGYIPELTTIFAQNDYFTLDKEDTFETKVYKTSAIVSLEQHD